MKTNLDNTFKIAERLLNEQHNNLEKNPFSKRLKTIIEVPESKFFLIQMMDVAFRSKNYQKVAAYIIHLLSNQKSYKALFSPLENFLLQCFKAVGNYIPNLSIQLMLQKIQATSSDVVFFIQSKKFKKHIHQRSQQGITLNINLIGEALIGEEEAKLRIKGYLALLDRKDVNYISIKISTIYSQISSLARNESVNELIARLCLFYDKILEVEKETGIQKFVNLDMEEYKDLEITFQVFIKTLSLPKYKNIRAGIVLQAYLPETIHYYRKLKNWATERVDQGGSPIKVRLVKGANMEMELTEASLEDWPLATYSSKVETDANYKKILSEMLTPNSAKVLNVGVASHNLFDISYALQLIKESSLENFVDFEMLEGMANEMVTNLLAEKVNLLLYTPTVKANQYNAAIAYLVRRLDEGTQDGNFLKEGYQLKVGSKKWDEIQTEFVKSVALMESVNTNPHRIQNRNTQKPTVQTQFKNVPNTDWNLTQNINWANQIKDDWKTPTKITGKTIPVVGDLPQINRATTQLINWNKEKIWEYELGTTEDFKTAINSTTQWQKLSPTERAHFLKLAAVEIEKERANLIGVAMTELGKTLKEVDVEVSEAIDFANFYADSSLDLAKNFEMDSSGINLVLSPWNFPIAIPIGGVLASLAAGKKVILKPSLNASACAYLVCKCLWKVGIPKTALYFIPCLENTLDPFLSSGNTFDAVILTGGTDTAHFLLKRNPILNLYAETGGKNNTIVTSLADKEQACINVVQSAFGNAGQKCSATSLLILTEDVFEDDDFKEALKDAALSKTHGSPWKFKTEIGPLAVPISDKIKHVLENTPKENWLIQPSFDGHHMLSPGIIWGVTPNEYTFKNELFGPILSVVKAKDLEEAIAIANKVDFGLTSGLESLDKKEIDYWSQHIQAGNKYVNRSTTGAIVERQPFGGIKASCFGFGMKAGGINYVLQFSKLNHKITDWQKDYTYWHHHLFSKEIDYANLRGQYNICSYKSYTSILLLHDTKTPEKEIEKVKFAAQLFKTPITIDTIENAGNYKLTSSICVRVLGDVPECLYQTCHKKAIYIHNAPVNNSGRLELLNYVMEQSYSHNYHRYGNLMGVAYNASEKPKFYE